MADFEARMLEEGRPDLIRIASLPLDLRKEKKAQRKQLKLVRNYSQTCLICPWKIISQIVKHVVE